MHWLECISFNDSEQHQKFICSPAVSLSGMQISLCWPVINIHCHTTSGFVCEWFCSPIWLKLQSGSDPGLLFDDRTNRPGLEDISPPSHVSCLLLHNTILFLPSKRFQSGLPVYSTSWLKWESIMTGLAKIGVYTRETTTNSLMTAECKLMWFQSASVHLLCLWTGNEEHVSLLKIHFPLLFSLQRLGSNSHLNYVCSHVFWQETLFISTVN